MHLLIEGSFWSSKYGYLVHVNHYMFIHFIKDMQVAKYPILINAFEQSSIHYTFWLLLNNVNLLHDKLHQN